MDDFINCYNTKFITYMDYNINDNPLNNILIYVINLEDNITRRNYLNFVMAQMKINYNLVIVNKITDEIYETIKTYTILNKSKLGCAISHLYCIKKGIETGSNKFLIFEDDIIFHKRFNTLFTETILHSNFDMIMLGACDFNFNYNNQNTTKIINDVKLYTPVKIVLGAHANLYSVQFAKKLYEYKISNKILEFDTDFRKFYGRNSKIYICNPNLVVTELTTTNLGHYFGFNSSKFETHIKKIFGEIFTYKNYNYITIDFINYVKNIKEDMTFKEIVELYVSNLNLSIEYKNMIYDSLLYSNYSIEDIKLI